MTIPTPLNSGEPARRGAGSPVTLVEGATFCLSDRHGYVAPGGSHALYFRADPARDGCAVPDDVVGVFMIMRLPERESGR
jgi:hypothetical protein